MAVSEIRLTQPVAASTTDVWEVLTDLDNADKVLSGCTRVERVSGAGYVVGTRWRETRKLMGKEDTEEMWVAEIEAPRRTVIQSDARGMKYTTVFELVPEGAATSLSMTFSADSEPTSFVGKLLAPVMGRLGVAVTRKIMSQDLRDIAAAAEAKTKNTPG